MLEQGITKKECIDKLLELYIGNSKKYKVETIWDSIVYVNKLKVGYLPRLHYLIVWKRYPKK